MRKSLHLAAQNPPSHNNSSTLCETLLHAGMIKKKKPGRSNSKFGERKNIKDAQALTRREIAMGGLLVLLMKSLFSTTLLKGALERRAKNLYS